MKMNDWRNRLLAKAMPYLDQSKMPWWAALVLMALWRNREAEAPRDG